MGYPPLKIALIGCGALTELYYAPTLRALANTDNLEVSLLLDPDPERSTLLQAHFPAAKKITDLKAISSENADFAIVASPPRFHAAQAETLLHRGIHVLCEKPMAASAEEARRMVACARDSDRILSVGLFRRFFPSSEMIGDLIRGRALGAPLSFEWSEGGIFNWPAASPSFFQRSASTGGVLADSGTHVLDLLMSWFGSPDHFDYFDDALGGLEANASLHLSFPQNIRGSVRLSRDAAIPNLTRVNFERGSLAFSGASARDVVIDLQGCRTLARAQLCQRPPTPLKTTGEIAASYHQAFMAQVSHLASVIRGKESLRTTADEGLRVQLLIEACYASRQSMAMPWASSKEQEGITRLTSIHPQP